MDSNQHKAVRINMQSVTHCYHQTESPMQKCALGQIRKLEFAITDLINRTFCHY